MGKLRFGENLRLQEGLSHGAVYLQDAAEPWVGLISIESTTTSGVAQHLDGMVYAVTTPYDEYAFTVKGYTYPELLETAVQLDGLTYKDSNYLYLVYNPLLYLNTSSYATDSDSTSVTTFELNGTSKPTKLRSLLTSRLLVDLATASPSAVTQLTEILYGTDTNEPRWPSIEEVEEVFESNTLLRIIDHGDGTWSAIGPDSAIKMVSPTEFEITWPSAIPLTPTSFRISSL